MKKKKKNAVYVRPAEPLGPLGRHRDVQRFRGGLVFKAHRLLYHSTLGLRVIQKKKKNAVYVRPAEPLGPLSRHRWLRECAQS